LQKTLILIILVLNQGCTSRIFLSGGNTDSGSKSIEDKINSVRNNNISQESYFIEKADLLVNRNNSTTRFIFTVKYEKPDRFLLSIRNIAGLEGARIYITKDTILINDRIQKRLLCGKPESLEKITGIPYYFVNMAFGDLLVNGNNVNQNDDLINNQLIILQTLKGDLIRSVLETRIGKVKSVVFLDELKQKKISLEYSKFSKTEKHFPEVIELKDYKRNISARIRIRKMQIPWNGAIEFIPGYDYKREEIR
jgi:hypothetical protein